MTLQRQTLIRKAMIVRTGRELQTALALNTLLNFGAPGATSCVVDAALHYLLETQWADGSWPSAPYYYGGPKKAVSSCVA